VTRPNETSISRVLPLSSDPALRRRFMVVDEPMQGNLRFGLMLEVLDLLAGEASLAYVRRFHSEAQVVTAAVDSVRIRHAGDVTRDLVFHARINLVGRTSMEVGIRAEHPGDPPDRIASCYFTMVARSGSGAGATSISVPPLEYGDELERHRAENALARREAYRREQAAASAPPGPEERSLLATLHRDQQEPGFEGLQAGKLVTESWERMYPDQEGVPKTIFGGYLIRRAFELSSICAELVAPDRPVVVAVNRINFFHPVRLDDKLHFTSRVVYTGTTSICVETGIERLSRDRTSKALSNICLFTFVNVDRDLAPRPVPKVYPATAGEDASYLEASRHHQAQLRGQS